MMLPWSYDRAAKKYAVNSTFYRIQSFLLVACIFAIIGISFFNG